MIAVVFKLRLHCTCIHNLNCKVCEYNSLPYKYCSYSLSFDLLAKYAKDIHPSVVVPSNDVHVIHTSPLLLNF